MGFNATPATMKSAEGKKGGDALPEAAKGDFKLKKPNQNWGTCRGQGGGTLSSRVGTKPHLELGAHHASLTHLLANSNQSCQLKGSTVVAQLGAAEKCSSGSSSSKSARPP